MRRLEGKVAVVTGAATGIGEATAELFAEEGASVVVLDCDREGEKVAKRIGGMFSKADISMEEDVKAAVATAEGAHGRIDILVNNAAVFVLKGLEATTDEWRRSLDVNVIGTSLVTRYASEVMKKHGGGSIVNISSINERVGLEKKKRFVDRYTQITREDLVKIARWDAAENAGRAPPERILPAALIIKACALGLAHVPELNGHHVEGRFQRASEIKMGIGIALRGGGLIALLEGFAAD